MTNIELIKLLQALPAEKEIVIEYEYDGHLTMSFAESVSVESWSIPGKETRIKISSEI